ncbi:nitroreductase/quinone reductase family protein [Mycobacterium sp.]|uniref:nitroreductase/quinone reductase family protein n=1 Tax=Mycobacterium sp. TaxID=1785 RepID=UPI003F9E1792
MVLKLSGGRLLTSAGHMPVLELVTIGRKTGLPRSVFLTSPLQDGEVIYVVGSRTGSDIDPGWVHNVRANPKVEVSYQGGPRTPMLAHVASPAERAQLWPRITVQPVGWTTKKNLYADYQTRTERELPVVALEPI